MFHIVISKKDAVGINIAKYIKNFSWMEEDIIFAEDRGYKDTTLFLSRHESKSKKPCLTTHFPGNFGKAEHGGRDKTLAYGDAIVMYNILHNLKKLCKLKEVLVSYEATHHGPSAEYPSIFAEIGSTYKEWSNEELLKTLATAVELAQQKVIKPKKVAIGIGGSHYAPKFTDYALRDEIAFGHILPSYNTKNLTEDIFKQMISKTLPRPSCCVVDKRGLTEEILEYIEKLCEKYELELLE